MDYLIHDRKCNKEQNFHPPANCKKVVKGYDFPDLQLQPPHDNIGVEITKLLPCGKNADVLIELIKKSETLFKDNKINLLRRNLKKNEASSIWLWGHGKKARMESFHKKYGLNGAAITAVDLVKGLAALIGFDFIKVEGATGSRGRAGVPALRIGRRAVTSALFT